MTVSSLTRHSSTKLAARLSVLLLNWFHWLGDGVSAPFSVADSTKIIVVDLGTTLTPF